MQIRTSSLPSRRTALPTFLLIVGLAWFFSASLFQFLDRVRQTHPWSFQHQVSKAFETTTEELACLRGQDPDSLLRPAKPRMPKVVHFIYGLRNPLDHPSAGTFDFLCYLAVRSALLALHPDEVRLHYTYLSSPPSADAGADPHSNEWIARLARDSYHGRKLKLVHHPPEEFAGDGSAGWQAAHVSDVLRLRLLLEHGGIYLDMDAFALRPWDDLLAGPRDLVLGAEGGNRWGLCNAVMAARPGSRFVARWLAAYEGADLSREWNYHSVLLPKELAESDDEVDHLRSEVCTLGPAAFFWPTWTWHHIDWMHAPLSRADADACRADLEEHEGGLFPGQVAYHAWNQMAWDRYLKHLTPYAIRNHDTRFNILVRRFMEDDL